MANQIPIKHITLNISSKGTEYESEIQDWLNDSEHNKRIYRDLMDIWLVSGSFPDWFSPDKSTAWHLVREQIHQKKKKTYLYRRIGQIAAAIIIVVLCIYSGTILDRWTQKPQYTEIFSPAGQKTRIVLPDSSIVLLNGHSKIRFDHCFNDNKRIVELSGEGYFDVRQDLSRQFVVSTPDLKVKVFGTSFNVKAYENDPGVEVGLKSGKISISRNDAEMGRLSPGQLATYNKTNRKLKIENKNIDLVSAWTREEIIFDAASLQDIVRYLERWYGIEIQVAPELLDGQQYTFKVKTESLNELLKLINILRPINYHIDGKRVIITNP